MQITRKRIGYGRQYARARVRRREREREREEKNKKEEINRHKHIKKRFQKEVDKDEYLP